MAARAVHTRWSLEGTGVFVAIGLGVVVLAWLVAPHVGKVCCISILSRASFLFLCLLLLHFLTGSFKFLFSRQEHRVYISSVIVRN